MEFFVTDFVHFALGSGEYLNEMDGACTRMGEMRNAYKILVEKPEGK
jgi:hypothetical protein